MPQKVRKSVFCVNYGKIICMTTKKDFIKECLMLQFKERKFVFDISRRKTQKFAGDIDENI